jgi:hypothetical protein
MRQTPPPRDRQHGYAQQQHNRQDNWYGDDRGRVRLARGGGHCCAADAAASIAAAIARNAAAHIFVACASGGSCFDM